MVVTLESKKKYYVKVMILNQQFLPIRLYSNPTDKNLT